MRRDELGDLGAFLAVAQERSFTRAAAKLGTSQSALSHTIRRLEERLGIRLLTRTTRSVSTTEAGERLLDAVHPAIDSINRQLENLSELRDRPAGTIRITTSEHAAQTVLWPTIDRFLPDYPDVHVELNAESGFTDIAEEGFDAGVRLGEQVAKDMIAVRIGPQLRMAVIGAPSYLATRGAPKTPHDLTGHNCINLRMRGSGGLYVWEFEKAGKAVNVRVEGQLTLNSVPLILDAVRAGHGLAYVMEDRATPLIESGAATRVMEPWCPSFDGYHLYYPSRRQPTPAFSLLVEALRFRP
jgi:DNA-binding transcriptional LysR family regulator